MRPPIDILALASGELRVAVNHRVSVGRHLAAPNGGSNACEEILLFLDRIFTPVREIHVAASLAHIALHQPGHWSDMAVPRPLGLFGMAVLT